MSAQAGPFRRGVVVALVVVGLGSLVAAILFGIYGDPRPGTAGANTFSRSAIGHEAYTKLLDETGRPFLVSRHRSAERARDSDGTLVVLEPTGLDRADARRDALHEMLDEAPTALVVLPKWVGLPDDDEPGHLASVDFVRESELDAALEALDINGYVGFYDDDIDPDTIAWRGLDALGGVQPTVPHLQVIVTGDPRLEPLVTTDQGVFLGRIQDEDDRVVWVLSDPDILETHGLTRGDNAQAALAVTDLARQPGRTLVIDETLHGFALAPSLSREMMSFPLVLFVFQALLLLGAVVWTGGLRFGSPRRHTALGENDDAIGGPSRLLSLIENTAAVLARSQYGSHTITRYLSVTMREVASSLGAPPVRSQEELVDWLAEAGEARGASVDLRRLREDIHTASLETRLAADDAVALAARIHQWKRELLHGPLRDDNAGPARHSDS